MTSNFADLVITGGRIWTQNPSAPWAEALAVAGGTLAAVGTGSEVAPLIGPNTEVHDVEGAMIMPGLIDGHVHLHVGGSQAAFELALLPTDNLDTILEKVGAWADQLEPGAWVVGGIVGSTVMDALTDDAEALARLDKASDGRPVMLRDDTMHNRWVSSRALELMGVSPDSPDPTGGRYVRDTQGRLTGVLHETASAGAEAAFASSIPDRAARVTASLTKAIEILNSYGVTSAQEAATMLHAARGLAALEATGDLNARVVLSMPMRPFLEEGIVGEELIEQVSTLRGELVLPNFAKFFLDGVPMTRTTALLSPYRCHHGEKPSHGEIYWELEDLVEQLRYCAGRGLGAKLHATGDASVRRSLDAAERLRNETGATIPLQIAHPEFIDADDVARFGTLNVVADLSPYIWYPGVIQDSIAEFVDQELVDSSWPVRDLIDSGALVAAGSDWPCAAPSPDPWTGIETLVTRRNPDPQIPGVLNPSQALTVEEAIAAFTINPATAAGIDHIAGRLAVGYSADFIILDRNLFEIEPSDIHGTQVGRTYFGGRLVYERQPVRSS